MLRAFKTLALIDFLKTEKAQLVPIFYRERSQRFKKSQAIFHSVFSVFSQNIRMSKIAFIIIGPPKFSKATKIASLC